MLELESKQVVIRFGSASTALKKALAGLKESGFTVHEATQQRFVDTYFDTENLGLAQAGWSCRIRRIDGQPLLATLKQHNAEQTQMFRRREITQSIDVTHTADWRRHSGLVGAELDNLIPAHEKLHNRFEQRARRTNYRLTRSDVVDNELCLSLDRIDLAEPSLSYTELEIELVRGPEAILETAHAIVEQLPHFVSARMSKKDRALFNLDPIRAQRAGMPSHSWRELAMRNLSEQLEQAEYYAPYAWEGVHPEGVHQLRIACRRILAGLQGFHAALPIAEAGLLRSHTQSLFRRLGAVRDLDVHATDLTRLSPSKRYKHKLSKERRSAQRCLADYLAAGGLSVMREDLSRLTVTAQAMLPDDLSIEDGIEQQIQPQLLALRSLGQSAIRKMRPKNLHRLRLAAKTISYQLDCIPETSEKLTLALGSLQHELGRHQDAQISITRIRAQSRGKNSTRALARFERRSRRSQKRLKPVWRSLLAVVDGGELFLLKATPKPPPAETIPP